MTDSAEPSGKKWFERYRPDGSMEPHVAIADDGSIVILDNGWAASCKDGKWHNRIMFQHDQLAEFTPLTDPEEIYRLLAQAQDAVGGSRKDVPG